jgi:hypothetical protein
MMPTKLMRISDGKERESPVDGVLCTYKNTMIPGAKALLTS